MNRTYRSQVILKIKYESHGFGFGQGGRGGGGTWNKGHRSASCDMFCLVCVFHIAIRVWMRSLCSCDDGLGFTKLVSGPDAVRIAVRMLSCAPSTLILFWP
jgi:hypothetical protein